MSALEILASLYLLRLEARIVGAVAAGLILGVWLLIDVVAGDATAYYVFPLGFAAIALAVVAAVVGAIIRAAKGPDWAAVEAAHRRALKDIGADVRYD
jgi:hypothetical protein